MKAAPQKAPGRGAVPGPKSLALLAAEAPFIAPGIQRIAQLSQLAMVEGRGCTLVDADGNEYLDWMGLLRSATAFEAYCKVYTADLTPYWILEFLLLDQEFPHSVRFSIDSLQCALEAIHGESGKSRAEPLRRC